MDEQALRRVADAMMMQAPPPPTWSPGVAMVGGAMTPQAYNGEGGAPMGPSDPFNRPGTNILFNAANGIATIPQRAIEGAKMDAANFGQPGYESQAAGPAFEAAMLMAGRAPFSEAGSLGAGGGRLRNQFTGQFRKEGETPLPGSAWRSINTQAEPVAMNSAEAQARYGFPGGQAPVDPALLEANLARLDNPMVQQAAPVAPPVAPAGPSWMDALKSGSGWL